MSHLLKLLAIITFLDVILALSEYSPEVIKWPLPVKAIVPVEGTTQCQRQTEHQ